MITLTAFACILALQECKPIVAEEHFISIEACDAKIETLNNAKADEILTQLGVKILGYTCANTGELQ